MDGFVAGSKRHQGSAWPTGRETAADASAVLGASRASTGAVDSDVSAAVAAAEAARAEAARQAAAAQAAMAQAAVAKEQSKRAQVRAGSVAHLAARSAGFCVFHKSCANICVLRWSTACPRMP
eukprot:COSAG02_NODE_6691_length_3419_cov_1.999699_3_plen_123_part_00